MTAGHTSFAILPQIEKFVSRHLWIEIVVTVTSIHRVVVVLSQYRQQYQQDSTFIASIFHQ
jgi:hypothetical protein